MNEEEEKKKMLGQVNPVLANLTPEQLEEAERIHKELATVTPTPTPVVKKDDVEATPTGVDYLKQFTEKYTPELLTEEELNRRKRAAHVMSGIGALGNAASAISNLIYTGEGAPSQTLPKNVDASAEIAKLEETEKAKRNEIYQRAKDRVAQEQAKEALKYKYAKDRVAQEQAKEALKYKYAKDAQDNKYKAAELQIKMDDLVLKKEKAEREGRLDEARILTESWKALKAQQDALDAPALNRARIGNYNSGSAANSARAEYYRNGGGGSRSELEIPYNGGTFQVSKNDWNNMSYLAAVATDLGVPIRYKEVKDAYGNVSERVTMSSEGKTKRLSKSDLQAAIGQALNTADSEKIKEVVQRFAGGGSTTGEPSVITYDPAKEETEEIEEYK